VTKVFSLVIITRNGSYKLPTRFFVKPYTPKVFADFYSIKERKLRGAAYSLPRESSRMKILVFVVLCLIAQEVKPQMNGLTYCAKPVKGVKKAVAPAAGAWYQIMRAKKSDKATCYNFKIIGSGDSIRVNESMVVDKVDLKQSYVAKANADGGWNMTLNSEH
jgi:hypothetical protein